MTLTKACARPGCPNLQPCPTHTRPRNAPWSPDRDRVSQHRFRQAVLERDGHRCTRCSATERLVAHHTRDGYDPSCGITLCVSCHRAVDASAR